MAALRMVVLGDSVTWGQGLSEDAKFSILVKGWLETQLNSRIDIEVLAHSGAVIQEDPIQDGKPPTPGEVPNCYPSITAQARSVGSPQDVRLVLVDGGINDMGAAHILNPLTALTPNVIRENAQRYCGRMTALLADTILLAFPAAITVVTGYWPIISEQTDPLKITALWHLFPALGIPPWEEFAAHLLKPLADQSSAWADASNETLQASVDSANPPGQRRAIFVSVPWAPEHCYAAPQTWLWTIGDHDPAQDHRLVEWIEVVASGRLHPSIECPFASAFHPNPQGAQAYCDAIVAALEPRLPDLRWKPGMEGERTRPAVDTSRHSFVPPLPDAAVGSSIAIREG